jgi:transcriptional regulator GlxA family with amidase domain
VIEEGSAHRHHAVIMAKLEEVLGQDPGRPLQVPQLSELIGVTGRTLQLCCSVFLGIGPTRYVMLRRLKQVRIALRGAGPDSTSVAEVARRHGFTQLGRFTGAYRSAFGESPSTTLQRASKPRLAAQ